MHLTFSERQRPRTHLDPDVAYLKFTVDTQPEPIVVYLDADQDGKSETSLFACRMHTGEMTRAILQATFGRVARIDLIQAPHTRQLSANDAIELSLRASLDGQASALRAKFGDTRR